MGSNSHTTSLPSHHPSNNNAGMVSSSLRNDARPVKSKALAFHVHLQEVFDRHPEELSSARIKIAFDILDSIVGEVGAFSSVLSIVNTELKKAVYSPGKTSNTTGPYFESVPYCLMIDRMQKIRSKEIKETDKEIDDLRQKLKFRDEDLDMLYRKNIQLKQTLLDAQSSLQKAQDDVNKFANEKEMALGEKIVLQNQYAQMEERYQKELVALQAVNSQATADLEMLTTFQPLAAENQDASMYHLKRAEIEISSQGLLKYEINQGKQITKQFSNMLDHLLEEFEGNLTQIYRRKEIKYGASVEDPEVMSKFKKDIEDTIANNKPRLDKYLKELASLKDHGQILELQEKRNESNAKLPSIDPINLTARKNAVILLTSQDGEKFSPFEKCEYCPKCGDRVLSCSHLYLDPKPILLPPKTTFLKLQRPILKLRSQTYSMSDSTTELQTEDEDIEVSPEFFKIWKNFYDKHDGVKPITKREFPLNKIIAFMQELFATKWSWESASTKDEDVESLLESLYRLLQDRYIYKNIYLKVSHDLFTSLQKVDQSNDHVALFILQLSGEQEEYWKYMHMVRKLVHSGPSKEVLDMKKYRAKIRAMYPDRESEVYDQIELEYCAFCKNKVSNESMLDQVAHMIRKRTEPNFQMVAKLADQFDPQQSGYLSFNDFSELCLKLVPTASAIEIEKRYRLAEKYYGNDKVKIDRIIAIGAYIVLYTSFISGWMPTGIVASRFV